MDSSPATYNSNNKHKKYKSFLGIRSDRLIFFICILIATLFWLLIKLSDIYSVNYTFKIEYNNTPPALRLTRVIDSTLDLSLTASGFEILKMNLFNDMEILDINLGNYAIDHRGGINYAIYTQELTTALAELIGVDEKDIQLSRAVLAFELEKTGEKILPIIPDYTVNYANQYDLYSEVRTDPKVVKVFGPQSVLDTLNYINTKKLMLEKIASDQVAIIELKNPNSKLLTFENDQVLLYFEVEKFTESELLVPINLSNMKYNIKTFPSQVTIYYRVAQKDFNEVRPYQFNIFPVVDNMDVLHAHKLPLKISKQPDFVRNIRIVPSEVEFLIIK